MQNHGMAPDHHRHLLRMMRGARSYYRADMGLLQDTCSLEEGGGLVVRLALDDARLPLCEVLCYAGVPWSARVVSRRFCTELEAGREALRIDWPVVGDAVSHRLRAMLSRLPWLESLDVSRCPPDCLASLALPQLTALKMFFCSDVTNLAPLTACKALQDLVVFGCNLLADVSALQWCRGVTALDMSYCTCLIDITPLASLSALATLKMADCCLVTNFNVLAACTALTNLDLGFCNNLADLAPLASCKALAKLNMRYLGCHVDLRPIAGCTALVSLDISGNRDIDISPLAACVAITLLYMRGCVGLADITPLQGCVGLTSVDMTGCIDLTEINSLASCGALKSVVLQGCPLISDITQYASCKHLEYLVVDRSNVSLVAQKMALRSSCPKLNVK